MTADATAREARSIYSDFVEYQDLDVNRVDSVDEVVYVIDTNVLLNLFKFTRRTAEELIDALEKMREVLFVPHETLREFWPLLGDVRSGMHHREASGKVGKSAESIRRDVETWLKRSGLEMAERGEAGSSFVARMHESLEQIEQAQATIQQIIGEVLEESEDDAWILEALERILLGNVGDSVSEGEEHRLMAEFEERMACGLPPATRDAEVKSNARKAAGDFFIWRQSVQEGIRRSRQIGRPIALTLVTADHKDDWTRSKEPLLARRELVREYAEVTGGGVFRIHSFKDLVETANRDFGATVTDASIAQVEAIKELSWTSAGVRQYLVALWNSYRDQLKLLLAVHAAEREGLDPIVIPEACKLVGREKMTAFTRPYKTILGWDRVVAANDGGLDTPMIQLVQPDGIGFVPYYYSFASDPGALLDREIARDDDFQELSEKMKGLLTSLRSSLQEASA